MAIVSVENEEKLEAIFKSELAIIFKHSKICPVSGIALEEMQNFAVEHPDIPVYLVDVLAQRPYSQKTAAYYGIRHESPQVIIVQDGAAGWNASHYAITAAKVAAALPPPNSPAPSAADLGGWLGRLWWIVRSAYFW